ncbi:MAG: hypothetical protein JKY62_12700 [Desulfocapsa sp.]|nr:hypothetical protein [Desulfocapsa sp.]MBN4045973.1 hypothetical protein [bacterium AH-315-P11]
MNKSIRLLELKEEEGLELTQEEYLELKLARRDQELRQRIFKKWIGIFKKTLLIIFIVGITGGIIAGGIAFQ